MEIRVKVQRHLAVGHIADDSGDWVFTVCRSGLSDLVGRRLIPGEEVVLDMEAEELLNDDDERYIHGWLNDSIPETD